MAAVSLPRSSALRLRSLICVLALFVLVGCTSGKASPDVDTTAARRRRRRRSQKKTTTTTTTTTKTGDPMPERMDAMEKQVKELQVEVKKLKAVVKEGGSAGAKPMPTPEVEACKGKKEKEACKFQAPDGSQKQGFCTAGKALWCSPLTRTPGGSPKTPGNPGGAPEKPKSPKPLRPIVQACVGKEEKDACWYDSYGSKKIGSCAAPSGGFRKLWCKKSEKGGADAPRHAIEACIGKKEEGACSFPGPDGSNRTGVCVSKGDEKIMWCRAAPFSPFPYLAVNACKGKKERDACTVTADGEKTNGFCSGGKCRVVWGDPKQAEKPQAKGKAKRKAKAKPKGKATAKAPKQILQPGPTQEGSQQRRRAERTQDAKPSRKGNTKVPNKVEPQLTDNACKGKKQNDACSVTVPDESKKTKGTCINGKCRVVWGLGPKQGSKQAAKPKGAKPEEKAKTKAPKQILQPGPTQEGSQQRRRAERTQAAKPATKGKAKAPKQRKGKKIGKPKGKGKAGKGGGSR